jgi:hypothetical protein
MRTKGKTSNHAKPKEKRKVCDPAFVLSEETSKHSATTIARKTTGREGTGCDIRSLAELVATRKGKGIRNSQHDGNNCSQTTLAKNIPLSTFSISKQHTNQTQPDKMQSENGNNTQSHPTNRLRIQRQPKESFVCSIYLSSLWICRLKDPVPIS